MSCKVFSSCFFFFFQAEDGIRDIGVTGVQTCALPIYCAMPIPALPVAPGRAKRCRLPHFIWLGQRGLSKSYHGHPAIHMQGLAGHVIGLDRKSTRLNSSHANISYAVFCLKKKKTTLQYKERTGDRQYLCVPKLDSFTSYIMAEHLYRETYLPATGACCHKTTYNTYATPIK